MKPNILLFIPLCLLSFFAGAQLPQDNLLNSFGSSLGETSESKNINVDLYTGTAQISFPIHQYSNPQSGLKHAIVIGYDAGGVKVDALASNLGLNWSLNTGGSVVRMIKGLPDEDAAGFSHLGAVPTGFAPTDTILAQQYLKDSLDGQFDIFSYNAGPASGKFIIGKNGQILPIPRTNVRIEKEDPVVQVPYCTSYKFKITIENGTAYYFNTFNCDQIYYSSGSRNASTEWFITKIVAPYNQDSILFSYTPTNTSHLKSGISVTNFRQDPVSTDPQVNNQFCDYEDLFDLDENSWRLSAVQYTDGTKLDLLYETDNRLDQYSAHALSAIEITNNGQSHGYNFYYNYTYRTLNDALNVDIPYPGYGQPYSGDGELAYSLQLAHFNKHYNVDTLPGYYFRYDYKYRSHDMQIGRFIQVDPLAESFTHNSTYAFSENKVTGHVELEGLEAVPFLGPIMPFQGKTLVDALPPPVQNSVYGTGRFVGGVAEMAAGAVGGAASSWTGLGGLIGAAAVVHGADNASAGFMQMTTGQPQQSLTQQGISNGLQAAGVTPKTASEAAGYADASISIALTGGAMSYRAPAVNIGLGTEAVENQPGIGFTTTRHGELTNGTYTVSKELMKPHVFGGISGKSIFYPTINANEAVLNAAQYADEAGLWINNAGTKAKVPVLNTDIGTTGMGQPTNIINVYRKPNGFIHGAPGN